MNELQIFNNPEFGEIRTVEVGGEPWLVGKDVAAALGYSNTKDALARHIDSEDKRGSRIPTPSGEQEMTIINESGLYALVLSSKLPGAKKFKRWVTAEVLPSIRKHGAYLPPETVEQLAASVQALAERVEALERRPGPARPLALEDGGAEPQVPGKAARKRWMRTISEKLDLMSERFGLPHNALLHELYQALEEQYNVVLDEERIKAMEQHDLPDCSVLTAIFYNPALRESTQRKIDYNLAPENRGW